MADFRRSRLGSRFLYRAALWSSWLDAHVLTVIQRVVDDAALEGIHIVAARAELAGVEIGPATPAGERRFRRGTQAWFLRRLLAARQHDPVGRIRKRVENKWRLSGLPGRTSRRIYLNLQRLRGLAPPRVRSAVLGTIFNRWTTDRRMRHLVARSGKCRLQCSETAADSIEHYVHCPVVGEWASRRLHLDARAMCMDHWLLAIHLSDSMLVRITAAIYVVYRTTQHVRNQTNIRDVAAYINHYMNQMLYEATRDDDIFRRLCGLGALTEGRARKRRRP